MASFMLVWSSLVVVAVLLASRSSAMLHPCCAGVAKYFDNTTGCTMAKCNAAMRLTSHAAMVEFLDPCREELKNYTVVSSTMECIAPLMNRSLYDAMVYQREGQAMQQHVAALVLGYGCIGNSKSTSCDRLTRLLFPVANAHIFGHTPAATENVTAGDVTAVLSLSQAIQECVASELDGFGDSEWNQGMAQCAAAGTDTQPADIAGLLVPAGVECAQCVPSSSLRGGNAPFCAAYFTGTSTARYGARCSRSLIADRIAQSYHDQWERTGSATIAGIKLTGIRVGSDCSDYLQELSCRTALGVCSGSSGVERGCKTECETSLMTGCGASALNAQKICVSVGATSTASRCPVVAPTRPPTRNFTVVTTSAMGTVFNVTFCSTKVGQDAALLMTVLTSVLQDVCKTAAFCELLDYENTTTSDPTCSFRVDAVLTTVRPSATTQQQFSASLQLKTKVPEAQITVAKTTYRTSAIQDDGSGQGQATAMNVLLLATLLFYFLA